jgi:hypothetical protein
MLGEARWSKVERAMGIEPTRVTRSELENMQFGAIMDVECDGVREGLSLYVGLIAGTYTESPRLGGVIGFAVDFPHLFYAPDLSAPQRSARAPGDTRSRLVLPSTGDFHDL